MFHTKGLYKQRSHISRWYLLWNKEHLCSHNINGIVQERGNSSALAMELHLSCANPSISPMGITSTSRKLGISFSSYNVSCYSASHSIWLAARLSPSRPRDTYTCLHHLIHMDLIHRGKQTPGTIHLNLNRCDINFIVTIYDILKTWLKMFWLMVMYNAALYQYWMKVPYNSS